MKDYFIYFDTTFWCSPQLNMFCAKLVQNYTTQHNTVRQTCPKRKTEELTRKRRV